MKAKLGSFEFEIAELAIDVCDEPWAKSIRVRLARRAALAKIKGCCQRARATIGKVTHKMGFR